jgi:hypothetical protein
MANTYEAIATVTVGSGGAANIEFTSIPATYTDLLVKLSGRSDQLASNGQDIYIQFNNDTGSNYSFTRVYGTGSAAASDSAAASATAARVGRVTSASSTASTFASNEIYIPNYAGASAKSISIDGAEENNATASIMVLNAALWSGTAAITSLKILPLAAATNFVQYSTATLYGIKKS